MIQTPTLRQIHYFVALSDHLSFIRAAEACNVTQSTLSGGLKDMENLLNEKLFERSSRGVTLTKTGQALLGPARDLLARAEAFVQMANQNRDPLTGPLTLGIIPTIAPYLLPSLLPALHRQFPQLQLQLREDITPRLAEGLERGQVDAVLMAFPYDLNHATMMGLWHEPFFIASPSANASRFEMAKIDAMAGEDVLLLDDGHCLRDHAMAACRLQPAARRKTFGATSLPTLIQMVQHGYGLTLLPAMAIEHGTLPKGVSINRFANPQPSRQIGLAWRENSPREKEYRLLGDFIVKSAAPR
jgi:LysR family hydrogen peroxide-inducible transcriptional activator